MKRLFGFSSVSRLIHLYCTSVSVHMFYEGLVFSAKTSSVDYNSKSVEQM